jgi:protein-S-isoprenylcysteine O-methyltransferase Ste14
MFNDYLRWCYLILFLIASIIRFAYVKDHRKNKVKEDQKTIFDLSLSALPGIGMIVLPIAYIFFDWPNFANYTLPNLFGFVGIIISVFGIWLLWRSHADLGKNWSPSLEIRKGHTLVVNGVYKYIRHPMYAAHWLWAMGQIFLLQNYIVGCSTLILFFPLYLLRVPKEEKMMLVTFGKEYKKYMQRTGKILPKVP